MISPEGIALIKRFEGFSPVAYLCPAGVWTIGYGHTKNVHSGDVIDETEAEELLIDDLFDCFACIDAYVDVPLEQCEYDALCSFIFNLGCGNFKSSTLLKLLNSGDKEGAAKQFKRWDKSNGKPLAGLTKRREAEDKLFRGE